MQQSWHPDELAQHWTLSGDERALLANKTGATRVAFAILLKAFQCDGRFPERREDIPSRIVAHLAQQAGGLPDVYSEVDWTGRSSRRHRVQILHHCGFRVFRAEDETALVNWPSERVATLDPHAEAFKLAAYAHLRRLHVEPPPLERLRRLLRTAVRQREEYYAALGQPMAAKTFVETLRSKLEVALAAFDADVPHNPKVKLLTSKQGKGRMVLSPSDPVPEAPHLDQLKAALMVRWPMTNLLDILKETELRVGFTDVFRTVGAREVLNPKVLRRRLLLALYSLGTNAGLKRMSSGGGEDSYDDLLYVRRKYITQEQLRAAIGRVCNAIFQVRNTDLWGEATTACASDSKQFGAWDQTLMTEWHARYGGPGVMVYWHVEECSVCIYSQLKSCSSSEVAAMIEGVLRHETEMEVEKNYVDTRGQSEVGFAFCDLLGFELLPRLKNLKQQRL